MFLSNVLTVHLSEASVKLNCTTYSYSIGRREREGGLEGRREERREGKDDKTRRGGREEGMRGGGEERRVKVAKD